MQVRNQEVGGSIPPRSTNLQGFPPRRGYQGDTGRALLALAFTLLAGGCAHESLTGPVLEPAPAPVAAPTPLPGIQPEFLAPPAPPQQGLRCTESFEYVTWRMDARRLNGWIIVTAAPSWGTESREAIHPVPQECLRLAVGPDGPEWIPAFRETPMEGDRAHNQYGDPYRFAVKDGTIGTLLACSKVGPACGKVTLSGFYPPAE